MLKQLKYYSSLYRRFHLVISFSLLMLNGAAQNNTLSTSEKSAYAFKEAVNIYDKELRRNTMVYTGRSYHDPHPEVKGHPFFGDDYWEQGKVGYDNNVYDSIYLRYDIYRDLILIENFNSSGYLSPITLYNTKVSFFDLMGYHFIRLEKDTISNLRTGFYNQMYSSEDLEVIIKRRKEIVKSNDVNSVAEMYSRKNRYYIKKDGVYHQVKKKNSILKVFIDQKKEVKSFIKANNFRFKYNVDEQIVEVVKHYDSLQ